MSPPSSLPTNVKANSALRSNQILIDQWRNERVDSHQTAGAMQGLDMLVCVLYFLSSMI